MPNVVLASQFDVLGNRTSLSATIAGTKDFFNSFGYDALSQLLSVTQMGQSGGNAVAPKGIGFAYNLDGQFTGALRFDPTTASPHPDIALGTFSYDAQGRLASLAYTHAGNPIDTFGYQYDTLDRVSQFSSIDGTASYAYDKTSQLTSVVYTGGGHQPANESFQYDPNGNQKGPSPAGPNFTVGADNLLSSDGTFDLFYDAEGNLIEKKRISTAPATDYDTKQAWDYRNRLTDVWQYNNSGVLTQHEHLVYDPFDRLIGRYIDSTGNGTFDQTQLYVYDGTDVVLQFNAAGSLTNRYLNAPSPSGSDQVFAEEDVTSLTSPGTVTWPLTDQQGSPRDIVNSASVLVDHIIYSAFGQTVYESSPSVHHLEGFAGGLPDPVTGEIHFGARNLNAVDAVWSSEDPTGFLAGDTNLSRYTGNSPTNYTDPTGLAKRTSVGHHYANVARVERLHRAGKITDEAYHLAMGFYTGPTSPRHSGGSCDGVTHDRYTKAVDKIFEAELKKLERRGGKPLSGDQMDRLIRSKIIGSSDPDIRAFNAEATRRAKAFAKANPGVARPKTDKKSLIQQGKDFVKSNKGRLAKIAGVMAIAVGGVLDEAFGAIGEIGDDESPVRREFLAAIAAIEDENLAGASCHVVGTGKGDGVTGELSALGYGRAAAALEKTWNDLLQRAQTEAMQNLVDGQDEADAAPDTPPILAPGGEFEPLSEEEAAQMGRPQGTAPPEE